MSARARKRPPERVDANAHTGRVPPHDLDLERAVLSACILEGRMLDIAHLIPSDEVFYFPANRWIWQALQSLAAAGEKIDIELVAGWLKMRERFVEVGGSPYLAVVTDSAPVTAHVASYARRVAELWQARTLMATCQKVAAEGYGDVGDRAEWVVSATAQVVEVNALLTKPGGGPQRIDGVLRDAIQAQLASKNAGLSTGLRDLDAMTTGLHGGEVTIIAARPGMGKTSLLLDEARAIASGGRAALIFSLEMPKEQLAARMACAEANVDIRLWRARTLSTADWERINAAAEWIRGLPIYIDDTAAVSLLYVEGQVVRIGAECERNGTPLGLVGVDYLQLMTGSPNAQNREQEISGNSRGLKALAKTRNVPVVALSQLNRGVETRAKDKRPQLSDLRESGAIEQDADTIIMIYRDDYYDPHSSLRGIAEFGIAKQRNGPTGIVPMRWVGHCASFGDVTDEQRRVWDLTQENDGKKGGGR